MFPLTVPVVFIVICVPSEVTEVEKKAVIDAAKGALFAYMGGDIPSMSEKIAQKGLITVDKDGYIKLTTEGNKLAQNVFERHTIITKMLTTLGVSEETAADDACRIEHVISPESFEAMKRFLEGK